MTPEYNPILIFLIAALNAFTAWTTLQSKKTISNLEKNTNSIKDALMASTAKTSYREGSDAAIAMAAKSATAVPNQPVKVDIVKLPPQDKA